MNENNNEVTGSGKTNKKRRFRPKNKNKQTNSESTALVATNGSQTQSVIDNFFAAPFGNEEQHTESAPLASKKLHKHTNKKSPKVSNEANKNVKKETNQPAANTNNEVEKTGEKKARKKKIKRNLPAKLIGNEPWQQDIASAMQANEAAHELILEPLKYLNSSDHKIRITPLGGLGEIGGNMTIFETETSAIIVDIGMSFPNEGMHGVDILIPDFDYVRKIKDKIAGIIITHAHEDHIGAVPYFFKEFKFPIYATPLPLGMINNKFEEHGLKSERSLFRSVEKRKPYMIGEFEVEWIHITHSIIDASALAITTKAGTIIHTGDFKIDHTPIDGYPSDLGRLAHYGERGVLCLMSDSTNSYREGFTKSESSVGKTFDAIFAKSKGRVIMSTFSSNIHRVYQAIEWGLKYNRKVCVIGRSMERNLFTAMELGYIKLDRKIFIDANEVGKYKDDEVLIVTTGSQGETMSALYRMATDEHKYIKIKPTDQIIISSKAIPGNEGSVSTVLNFLIKSGAKVAYQDFSEIHVSGHAAQEEQKLMVRLIKPKFFLPVHGEYNHIAKHKETAISCGVDEKNIYLMSDGDQIEVCQKYMKRIKTVKTGKVFIDNQINKQIADDVVIDRQNLAESGVVMIIAQISSHNQKLIGKPRVISYGLVANKQDGEFSREMQEVLVQFLTNVKEELLKDNRMLEGQIRQVLRKHIFRKVKKYPTIVPIIYLM
ncbi:ribonuclease J [Campylobacter sp. RM9344]|uniref:Ribonuclease J n=1 Tax=Campylobacter californiensis TaxID=1032243 RepID=A0AAW3ZYU1_9BACT|nr:ribonuclease J [Campylobacter sp. RM6914]MBE2984978.1 ribonuclease J [Campylobacter sp. RM6883]MBE2995419.1 ribonuclease J [Campylobacter sp. RM6913]MBE3030196.1 ribonuclease J [Campylobacter sp. RM9344]MBE3608620.1 ribonuclease J [Campylobacter sp. RM9337]QCD49977.1 mRNA degradation ribonuclease J1/J2 (metallo-beta-lactamase superfamily) [Campylobacter sp. RM6914]